MEAWFYGEETMSDLTYDAKYGEVFCWHVYDAPKKTHPRMCSIRKVSKYGAWDWFTKIRNQLRVTDVDFCAQTKIDGIAGVLIDGVLVTRGDGTIGNVINTNLPRFNTPIYGELYSTLGRAHLVKNLFSLRAKETFRFMAYDIDVSADYDKKMAELKQLGFVTPETTYFKPTRFEDFSNIVDKLLKMDAGLPSDGLVLKIVKEAYRQKVGHCKTFYNHAVAIKRYQQ